MALSRIYRPFCLLLSQVIRSHDLGNWTLQIKYPHLRDNGVYECQINTEPKMSLSYVLNVVGKQAADDMTTCCDNCFRCGARKKILFWRMNFPPTYQHRKLSRLASANFVLKQAEWEKKSIFILNRLNIAATKKKSY